MKCKEIRDQILDTEYDLGERESKDLLSHMDQCPKCRELAHSMRGIWFALDEMPILEPQPDFNQRVWRRIESRPVHIWDRLFPLPLTFPGWRLVAGALVLTAIFSIAYFGWLNEPSDPVVFSKADKADDQLLKELNQLIQTDESQFLSIYQPWETIPEANETRPETEDPPAQEPTDSSDKRTSQICINREIQV